jgi:putative spermidine/putrescine transport system permease protein
MDTPLVDAVGLPARPAPRGRQASQAIVAWLGAWGAALPLLLVVGVCLVAPVLLVLGRSVVTYDGIGLSAWSRVLSSPVNQRGIVTSIELGLICAALSALIGTPLAWLVSRMLAGRRATWLGLMNVAAHFGGIGLAFAYVATLGTFGMVTLFLHQLGLDVVPPARESLAALVIAYLHSLVPLFVLLTVPAMSLLRDEWWEAAQTASATRLQFWRRVGLPVLAPFIGAGFLLAFTWTIGIYGIAYAMAGESAAMPTVLITLQIGQALSEDAVRGPERAAVLAVLLTVLAVGALLAYRLLLRRGLRWFAGGSLGGLAGVGRAAGAGRRRRRDLLGPALLLGAFLVYAFLPIVAVVLYSLSARWTTGILPEAFTLAHWTSALASPRIAGAFATSLSLGVLTTVLVLALAVPAVYWARVKNQRIRPLLDISAAIPFALPFLVIGFAIHQFTGIFMPGLQGSFAVLLLAYASVCFPFVYWALDGAMSAADVRRLSEAAETCGASAWQAIRRVVLPNVRPGVVTAAMLSFALAIGEFAMIKVMAGSIVSVSIWSAGEMRASGGNYASLAVVTTIIFGLLFASSVVVAWVNRGRAAALAEGGGINR